MCNIIKIMLSIILNIYCLIPKKSDISLKFLRDVSKRNDQYDTDIQDDKPCIRVLLELLCSVASTLVVVAIVHFV